MKKEREETKCKNKYDINSVLAEDSEGRKFRIRSETRLIVLRVTIEIERTR